MGVPAYSEYIMLRRYKRLSFHHGVMIIPSGKAVHEPLTVAGTTNTKKIKSSLNWQQKLLAVRHCRHNSLGAMAWKRLDMIYWLGSRQTLRENLSSRASGLQARTMVPSGMGGKTAYHNNLVHRHFETALRLQLSPHTHFLFIL